MMLRLLLLCFLTVVYSNAEITDVSVDSDYVFSFLRDKKITCNKFKCQTLCGNVGLCIRDTCYCVTLVPSGIIDKQFEFFDSDASLESPEYLDESLLGNEPALRHHIAHFCPNLGDARKCIRTCMGEGKPAFCGKDHVCYCGHKYTSHDREPSVDAAAMYNQFQDLYLKHFGPNYKQELSIGDRETDS